jgi:hypothetical protein
MLVSIDSVDKLASGSKPHLQREEMHNCMLASVLPTRHAISET